jgi:hypothetical protein
MPRKPKPQKVPLKFKLEILGNLIKSDMDACGPKSDMTADERDMMAQMIKDLTLWKEELESHTNPKLSRDDIGWRICIIEEEITMWSHVIKEEMSLSDEDRSGMLTDIELFKRWKAELLRLKKPLK